MRRYTFFLVGYVILLAIGVSSPLAETGGTPSKPQGDTYVRYPVVLGDQTIFYLTAAPKGYGPGERARTISERIRAVAEDLSMPTGSITTSDFSVPMTVIMARDQLLVVVLDEDAKAEGENRQQLAAAYAQKLRVAIERYREQHDWRETLTSSVYFLIVTLVLVVLLFLLNRLYRTSDTRIKTWMDAKRVGIHFQSFELIRPPRIKTLLIGTIKSIRLGVFLVLLYAYMHLCLSLFPRTRPFADQLLDYIVVPLSAIAWRVWAHAPNLLILAIVALITYYAVKLAQLFFRQIEKGTISFKGFYPDWGEPTYKIVRVLIIALAGVIAFPYIPGSESPAFKGISIFLGVLFSLGSTSAMANILAGFTITYRRIFRVGDRVKIGDFTGDVMDVRLQVVHLRTIKNEEIVVPSSMIVNAHVINYSSLARDHGLILHTTVTIGYDTPWRQVEALLLMAADRTKGLMAEPAPFILQTSLDDHYVSYQLNVYTDDPLKMAVTYTELHRNIQDAFNEYGVQIMSPSYRFDPQRPKIVPKEQWYAPPAKALDDDRKS